MGLRDCFNSNDDRFTQQVKATEYKEFLEEINHYKKNEPEVYKQMVKDFERNSRETYYGTLPKVPIKKD